MAESESRFPVEGTPAVTIVIPCRNEERFIEACLDSIIRQDFPKDRLEVLILDGGSEDRTLDILGRYSTEHPYIKILSNPKKIVPTAMNTGIRSARGEFIIRMDAHSTYPEGYLNSCIRHLNETDADIVGGSVETLPGDKTLLADCIARMTSHPFGVGNSQFRTSLKAGYVDTVPFGAFRRNLFDKYGFYDERLPRNQDNELCSRVIQCGGKVYMAPDLRIRYFNQATLPGILSQSFRTGMWNVMTYRINSGAFRWRHFIPFIFIVGIVLSTALSLTLPQWRLAPLTLLVPYALLSLVVSLQISASAGWRQVIVLPWLFFLFHASYGLGTLWGILISFLGFWTLN